MLSHIVGFAFLGGFLAWAGYTAWQFSKTEGTFVQRLAATTKRSITMFVNAATGASLVLGQGILNLADAFNLPEIRTAIETNLTPKVATGLIAGIVLLNVAARFRSLGKDPS